MYLDTKLLVQEGTSLANNSMARKSRQAARRAARKARKGHACASCGAVAIIMTPCCEMEICGLCILERLSVCMCHSPQVGYSFACPCCKQVSPTPDDIVLTIMEECCSRHVAIVDSCSSEEKVIVEHLPCPNAGRYCTHSRLSVRPL